MNNIPLNVLSNQSRTEQDAINQVAAMINNSGYNRGQRRRLEKALTKTNKLTEKAQKKISDGAYKEYQKAVDTNYIHFFAALSITMSERYHWKEDEQHDQITSLLESVGRTIDKYAGMGYTTEDLSKYVEDTLGIVLVPDIH